MAITTAAADPRINKPHAGPFRMGCKKMCIVRLDVSGTYVTGGFNVAATLATFGMKWADQMLPITERGVNPSGTHFPTSVRFDRATQKLSFYRENATGHPEAGNGESWGQPDIEFLVIGS